MTLKDLSKAYIDREYANIPEHCRPIKKFSDSSANELTKSILAYLQKIKGWKAWRQSSDGRYLPPVYQKNIMGQDVQIGGGKFIPRSKGAKGAGDVVLILPPHGKTVNIEVKHGKDRMSDDQKKFKAESEAMGAVYIVVKTWDDFYFQISDIEKKYGKN